jgi:hypothetical protein
MAHPIPRRWAALATIAALLALSACSKSSDDPGSGPTGDGQLGGAASASADPSANPTSSSDNGGGGSGGGGGGGGGGGSTQAVDRYPKDAKTYMQQFLIALANNDKVRVAELSQDNPILIANNVISANGKLNTQWSSDNCGGTNCQWRNAHGDEASVSIEPEKLGLPNAVYYLSFDPTMLPNDPYQYVQGFLQAIPSNKTRGVYLSSDSIWNQFSGYQSFAMTSQVNDMGGGFTKVEIYQPNRQDEHYLAFKVLSQPGGKANAIKAACIKFAGCSL